MRVSSHGDKAPARDAHRALPLVRPESWAHVRHADAAQRGGARACRGSVPTRTSVKCAQCVKPEE